LAIGVAPAIEGLESRPTGLGFIFPDASLHAQTTVRGDQGRNPEGAAFLAFDVAFFTLVLDKGPSIIDLRAVEVKVFHQHLVQYLPLSYIKIQFPTPIFGFHQFALSRSAGYDGGTVWLYN
jgi:hypothetical protein